MLKLELMGKKYLQFYAKNFVYLNLYAYIYTVLEGKNKIHCMYIDNYKLEKCKIMQLCSLHSDIYNTNKGLNNI